MSAVLQEARALMIAHWLPAADYCRQHGIDLRRVASVTGGGPFLAPIRLMPMRRFEIDPDSATIAVVVEALGPDGESVEDLVAWSRTDPTRVRTAIGVAAVLGENVATNAATCAFGLPLRLHRTPLGWLRSGADGCAIIDTSRAVRWLLDLAVPGLAPEDDDHAAEIHRTRIAYATALPLMVPRQSADPLAAREVA